MCMCVCACVDWTGESSINDDRDKIEMANALESLTRKNHSFSIYYGKKNAKLRAVSSCMYDSPL
jgi:hypothetical protein